MSQKYPLTTRIPTDEMENQTVQNWLLLIWFDTFIQFTCPLTVRSPTDPDFPPQISFSRAAGHLSVREGQKSLIMQEFLHRALQNKYLRSDVATLYQEEIKTEIDSSVSLSFLSTELKKKHDYCNWELKKNRVFYEKHNGSN